MMDTMRDKLLTNPEHVLSFVEGVLSDEVSMMKERKQQGKGPLIQEIEQDKQDEELPELTVEGVEKMGMVETAISLLLASLECRFSMRLLPAYFSQRETQSRVGSYSAPYQRPPGSSHELAIRRYP